MPENIIKPNGPTKASRPDSGNANVINVPVLGIVKDNIDPTRSGRLRVFVLNNSGIDPDDSKNWNTVRYLSPFFGRTNGTAGENDNGTFKANPNSYGMWNSPPDIGTTVVCMFINGDMNYGFYVGCVPEPEALQMIPAIGASDKIIPNSGEATAVGGSTRLPVTNININNDALANTDEYITGAKPIHSYVAAVMSQQGILRDPLRGPISSSALRETPSRVGWGVSTPGRPIYKGGYDDAAIIKNLDKSNEEKLQIVARRGGHSIVMDDGDIIGRDQLIRIRTAMGHQILMSDDGQTLMLLHSNGQSYIELGKEGTIDMYSTNSVNVRTQGDLNLHADRNINMHAVKDLNLQAENIKINSEKDCSQRVGNEFKISSVGNYTVKSGASLSLESKGDISMASSAIAYVNGSKVNLNTGKTSVTPQEVKPIPLVAQPDTLFDATVGFAPAPGKLLSITSRAPAHQPWLSAGKGIDVQTDLNADAQLPSTPSTAVQSINQVSQPLVENPVTVSTTATIPVTGPVSDSIDKNTTNAILAAKAQDVAAGPAKLAATKGATIVTNGNKKQAVVGLYGQTPEELEKGGYIKPGASVMVNQLVNSGASVEKAMPSNIFTGKDGVTNLKTAASNISAQSKSVVSNLQQAQTSLTKSGLITGKEAGTQIAGLVSSAATHGVANVLNVVKNVAGGLVNASANLANNVNKAASGVLKSIGSGNFAAKVAQSITGGLGSLASSVAAMATNTLASIAGAVQGAAAGAFKAITSAFKPLKAGVPQNLTAIAKNSAAQAASSASKVGNILSGKSPVSGIVANAATAALTGALAKKVPGFVGKSLKTISQVATVNAVAQSTAVVANSLSNTMKNKNANPAATGAASVTAGASINSVTGAITKTNANQYTDSPAAAGAFSSITQIANSGVNATASLANTASSVATGELARTATNVAGGINNMPGGIESVASVVSKNTKNLLSNIPVIGNTINQLASSAMTGIKSILGKTASLKTLANSNLPAGLSAQLDAKISSVSSGGAVPVKTPTMAVNTVNRTSIDNQVASMLDDPAIPPPTFGAASEEAAELANSRNA